MSLAELSVANFNVLCSKSEGRDKLARIAQYAARFIVGATQLAKLKAGTRIYWVNGVAGDIMKQLASARRAHRWCKEFPVIQSIFQSFPTSIPQQLTLSVPELADRVLELLQKVTLAAFMIIDHIGWLKQTKLLKGGRRAGTGTIQLGLRIFCYSNMFAMALQLKRLLDAHRAEDSWSAKQRKCAENAFKHMLLILQTAHLSRFYESHDVIVGFAGIITSAMDVLAQWPEKKVIPKPVTGEKYHPDAKAMPR